MSYVNDTPGNARRPVPSPRTSRRGEPKAMVEPSPEIRGRVMPGEIGGTMTTER